MEIIKIIDVFRNEGVKKCVADAIKNGKIFVYPTDTVYGIGCNVENIENVKKIYEAKKRPINKPFSIIVPSKEWIFEHTKVSDVNKKFIDNLLPGPYTIILKAKELPDIPKIIVSDKNTIGVRIPKNEFTDFIRQQEVIFITTSVNLSEEEPVTKIDEIPESIKKIVDYAIDSGVLDNQPSRIFDLTTDDIKIVRY
jgi:L-threonylcarbamoyladenylate synthase